MMNILLTISILNLTVLGVIIPEQEKVVIEEIEIIEEPIEIIEEIEIIDEPIEIIEYATAFCDTITRWENNNEPVAVNNFHGVQISGVNVDFPFNGYNDSFEWCNEEYGHITKENVEHYICEVYQSMNTCQNINQFKNEIDKIIEGYYVG